MPANMTDIFLARSHRRNSSKSKSRSRSNSLIKSDRKIERRNSSASSSPLLKPQSVKYSRFKGEISEYKEYSESKDMNTISQDRRQYLKKIQEFYEKNPRGPNHFIDCLIDIYRQYIFKESSLKNTYEEYQNQVLNLFIGLVL